MASWQGDSVGSAFDAANFSNKTINERSQTRTSGSTGLSGSSNGFFGIGASGYDIVGMNANKVNDMRSAIRNYVDAVNNYIDDIQESAETDKAFKSEEVKKAVQAYILKAQDYCKALCSQLLAFSDKIQDVSNAWKERTNAMAEDISTSKSGFGDSKMYTENIQAK